MEKVIREMRKAYKSSEVAEYDRLIAEERRWKRKATIAGNKLADVREDINQFAKRLADAAVIKP